MTDADFVASILADHEWHSNAEILRESFRQRGCGLTVHSRTSELRRKRGLHVEYRRVPGERGNGHQYRLIATVREADASDEGPMASASRAAAAPGGHRDSPIPLSQREDPPAGRAVSESSGAAAARPVQLRLVEAA
jgi:hypothetical protein